MAKSLVGNNSNISTNLVKGFVGNASSKACKILKGFVGDAKGKAQLFFDAVANVIKKVTWDTVEYIGTGYTWYLGGSGKTKLDGGSTITNYATTKDSRSENGLYSVSKSGNSNGVVYKFNGTKYERIIASGVLLNYIKTLEPFSSASSVSASGYFFSGNGDELLVDVFVKGQGQGIVTFNIHEDGTWSLKKNHGIVCAHTSTTTQKIVAMSIDLSMLVIQYKEKVFALDSNDEYQEVFELGTSSSYAWITIDKKYCILRASSAYNVYYIDGNTFTQIGTMPLKYQGTDNVLGAYNPTTNTQFCVTELNSSIQLYKFSETGITQVGYGDLDNLTKDDWDDDKASYESDLELFSYLYTSYEDEMHDGKRALVTMKSKIMVSGFADSELAGQYVAETSGVYEYDVSKNSSGMITAMSRRQKLDYTSGSSSVGYARYLNPSGN